MNNLTNYSLPSKRLNRSIVTKEIQSKIDCSLERYRSLIEEASDRKTSHARSLDIKNELKIIRKLRRGAAKCIVMENYIEESCTFGQSKAIGSICNC